VGKEKKEDDKDPFISFRVNNPHWIITRPKLEELFEGKVIPANLELHLQEFTVLRAKGRLREISKLELSELVDKFGRLHEPLFENQRFESAIAYITKTLAA